GAALMRRRDFVAALGWVGVAGAAGAMFRPRGRGNASAGLSGGASPASGATRVDPERWADLAPLPERWGVQLYTVRDAMEESVPATLAAVAAMGYGEVEFAGLFGHSPARVRRMLGQEGLRAASSHVGMDVIRGGWEAALDDAATLGQDLIVLPSLPAEVPTAAGRALDARTPDGLRALAEELTRAGEAARARGIHLGFHNHEFEVRPLAREGGRAEAAGGGAAAGGRDEAAAPRPLDLLLAHSDPAALSFQLDLYWTVHGGADPEAWFRDHPGRFLSVHLKDRAPDGRMVDVGAGSLDFKRLLEAGEAAGVRHAFVEHDRPERPLESIRAGIRHLRTLRG
ncbi:MAG: sugar phosphate isomerase/epimerase, partial [Longimicrobiales bacterium]|nr:sugar phosphate isomerase/epimerase [Longimicrobiales bacterium]